MAAPKGNQYAKGHGKGRPKTWDDDAIENEAEDLVEWIKIAFSYYIGVFAYSDEDMIALDYHEFARKMKSLRAPSVKLSNGKRIYSPTMHSQEAWDPTFTARVMARVCGPEWKNSFDSTSEESLKALATAVMNYATSQPQDKGWQQPQPKKKS